MVNIEDISPGNLLIHKDVGLTIVVNIEFNAKEPEKSIIHGADYDDTIYSGPCEDWFYLWASHKSVRGSTRD